MSIEQAVAALRRGEIVGVPTDTLYGLAADPFREDALGAIFELKGRPVNKPLAILVASLEQGMTIASLSDRALDLAGDVDESGTRRRPHRERCLHGLPPLCVED